MELKQVSVTITGEQKEQLRQGYVIIALDGKTKLMLVDEDGKKVLRRVKEQSSSKPRFTTFYAPRKSTPAVCSINEADFNEAIKVFNEQGAEAYAYCYKRNGAKDDKGANMPLAEQVAKGLARVVRFRVTDKIGEALKTDGIVQAYEDKDGKVWYLRNDIEEVTDGLTASHWLIDTDTIVKATIEATIDWQ